MHNRIRLSASLAVLGVVSVSFLDDDCDRRSLLRMLSEWHKEQCDNDSDGCRSRTQTERTTVAQGTNAVDVACFRFIVVQFARPEIEEH